jgi:hypothetical protein
MPSKFHRKCQIMTNDQWLLPLLLHHVLLVNLVILCRIGNPNGITKLVE